MNGFQLENILVSELDQNIFSKLNPNLKNLISKTFIGNKFQNHKIYSKKYPTGSKPDIYIEINGIKKNISLKKGTGNSFHQEPIESFIEHLHALVKLPTQIENDLRLFIWGDGSLDGSGHPRHNKRYSASSFVSEFPETIERLRDFFSPGTTLENLIRRFTINGAVSDEKVDYIVYAKKNYIENCTVISSEKFINLANTNSYKNHKQNFRTALPIGIALSLQAWNRNITCKPDKEKRRGHIQLKITKIGDEIINDG
tara:strand:- start:2993 stop:3760 length:768 start_codon:yes stop_codon:yes gene_type:complete